MLEGVKVVELSEGIPGPYAGVLLAKLGAEVIKIEKPGIGDSTRNVAPWSEDSLQPTPLFLALNAAKKSVALDLSSAAGAAMYERLIARADVVIEDGDTEDRSPLSLEELHAINPALVVGSVSSLSAGNSRLPALCAYAAGGLLDLTGDRDREPIHTKDAAFYMAGLSLAGGVLGAVYDALLTGIGQRVHVSAADAVLTHFFLEFMQYVDGGTVAPRGAAPSAIQGKLRKTSDGFMQPYLQALGGTPLEDVAAFMDLPQLLEPEYKDFTLTENVARFNQLVDEWFADKTTTELLESAQAWRLAWSIVQDPSSILACPQLNERGYLSEVNHGDVGSYRDTLSAIASLDEGKRELAPPPRLGEHTESVLRELVGRNSTEFAELVQEGVFR